MPPASFSAIRFLDAGSGAALVPRCLRRARRPMPVAAGSGALLRRRTIASDVLLSGQQDKAAFADPWVELTQQIDRPFVLCSGRLGCPRPPPTLCCRRGGDARPGADRYQGPPHTTPPSTSES